MADGALGRDVTGVMHQGKGPHERPVRSPAILPCGPGRVTASYQGICQYGRVGEESQSRGQTSLSRKSAACSAAHLPESSIRGSDIRYTSSDYAAAGWIASWHGGGGGPEPMTHR